MTNNINKNTDDNNKIGQCQKETSTRTKKTMTNDKNTRTLTMIMKTKFEKNTGNHNNN